MIAQTRNALKPKNAEETQETLIAIQQANHKPPRVEIIDEEDMEEPETIIPDDAPIIVEVEEPGLLDIDEKVTKVKK